MCLPSSLEGPTLQYIATSIGCLLCLNFGIMFGITPMDMRMYQLDNTPLNRPIGPNDATWISGYLFLGLAVGSVSVVATPSIGPKSMLLLSGLLQISGWFCIHFAYDILHIYVSRLLVGVAGGIAFAVLPIYITEISEEKNCNSLIGVIEQLRALGIVLGVALGNYAPYEYVAVVGIGCSFMFTMLFPFVPESPYYFKQKGNVSSLEKSLRWFRGVRRHSDHDREDFVREVAEFKSDINVPTTTLSKVPRGYVLKVFCYCLVLAVGAQFSGIYMILHYATAIFTDMTTIFATEVNVLLLAGVQLLGTIIAVSIVERIGRKPLLCFTAVICAISLSSLATFLTYGSQWQCDPWCSSWLPLAFLLLHMLSANIGFYPLAVVIVGELLPARLRYQLSSIFLALSWLLVFALIQNFNFITGLVGMVGYFWFFAGSSILVAIFGIFLLPETRGKSLAEVQQQLGYVTDGNVAKNVAVTQGHIRQEHF